LIGSMKELRRQLNIWRWLKLRLSPTDLPPAVSTGESLTASNITPATAIVDALHYFKAKKLSVATPYPEWNNAMLLRYLDEASFDVLNLEGDPRPASIAIREPMWDQKPESIVEFASKVCLPEADVLLCPCTAWRVLEVVEELEQRLGIPVVTANQAAIWATFGKLGICRPIHGFGRLLANLSSAKR